MFVLFVSCVVLVLFLCYLCCSCVVLVLCIVNLRPPNLMDNNRCGVVFKSVFNIITSILNSLKKYIS